MNYVLRNRTWSRLSDITVCQYIEFLCKIGEEWHNFYQLAVLALISNEKKGTHFVSHFIWRLCSPRYFIITYVFPYSYSKAIFGWWNISPTPISHPKTFMETLEYHNSSFPMTTLLFVTFVLPDKEYLRSSGYGTHLLCSTSGCVAAPWSNLQKKDPNWAN